jgi:UPF0755 protein
MKKDLFCRSLIVLGAVILFFLISFFIFKSKAYNSRVSDSNVVQLFEINKNEGAKTVGLNLSEAGLIKNKYYFYYQLWERKLGGKIQAGNYELSPNMKVQEIVDKIIKGEIKEAYQKLTIPEGFTNAKIVERMKKIDSDLAEEFGQIVGCKYPAESDFSCLKLKEKYEFLKGIPSGVDLEGYLFPDTYFIYPEDDAFKMVTKFLNNFQSKVDKQVLSGLEDQDKDLHQILTLASIVEKEVRSAEDMKKVAGIFWKRVEDDYLLQSCATLAYILGEDKKQYSYEDTQVESPFNTYTHKGLPPGPVSNPGLRAIEASVDPEENDYYYFLSDPQTNQTIFSKTLEEHNLNKNKYGL